MRRGATIVVVGGGLIGLSAARALAEAGGADVVVVERAALVSGWTGRSSGVVRCHYGVPALASMAWWSLPWLTESAERLGAESGYRCTGYVVAVGPDNEDALVANVAMQQRLGIPVERITAGDISSMWPGVFVDDFAGFAYEPRGGYGDGHLTALAYAGAARRAGAHFRRDTPVVGLVTVRGEVTGVELEGGERLGADAVVLCAGPWTTELAASVGLVVPIRPQRADILVVDPPLPPPASTPVLSDLVSLQYVRPDGATSLLVGDSDHSRPRWSPSPDTPGPADDGALISSITKFEWRFPGLGDVSLRSMYAGIYDVTPDYNPIISATGVGGLFVVAGFSGHGYKLSPAIGQLTADLVVGRQPSIPAVDLHAFRLARFDEGSPMLSAHPYAGAGQMR